MHGGGAGGGQKETRSKGKIVKLVGNAVTSPPLTSDTCWSLGQVMMMGLSSAVCCFTHSARHVAQNVWPQGSTRGRWAASSNGWSQMLHSRREARGEGEEDDDERRWRLLAVADMAD